MLNPLLAIESMWPARCLLLSESLVWCRMVTAESEYVCVGMNAHIRPKEQVAHWQLWETLRSACKHLKCPNASGRRIPSTTSRLSGHTIFQKHFPWCLLLGWNTLAMWKRKKKRKLFEMEPTAAGKQKWEQGCRCRPICLARHAALC